MYGHSIWRPLSRAERWRFARNSVWAFHPGDIPKSAYYITSPCPYSQVGEERDAALCAELDAQTGIRRDGTARTTMGGACQILLATSSNAILPCCT